MYMPIYCTSNNAYFIRIPFSGEKVIIACLLIGHTHVWLANTAAFTYYMYYDPAILRNKLTPLSIFRDLALRKRNSKPEDQWSCKRSPDILA